MIKGNRIKEARKAHNLSQQKLGDILGVSKVSICGYENGTRTPTIQNFIDLIKVLELDADYTLGRDIKVVKENDENYITLSNDDIQIIEELKKNIQLYNQLCEDPKRTVEFINRKLNK